MRNTTVRADTITATPTEAQPDLVTAATIAIDDAIALCLEREADNLDLETRLAPFWRDRARKHAEALDALTAEAWPSIPREKRLGKRALSLLEAPTP